MENLADFQRKTNSQGDYVEVCFKAFLIVYYMKVKITVYSEFPNTSFPIQFGLNRNSRKLSQFSAFGLVLIYL